MSVNVSVCRCLKNALGLNYLSNFAFGAHILRRRLWLSYVVFMGDLVPNFTMLIFVMTVWIRLCVCLYVCMCVCARAFVSFCVCVLNVRARVRVWVGG